MGGEAEDPTRIGELVAFYRAAQRSIPGVFGFASQASLFGRGFASSRGVDVDVTGIDPASIAATGGRLMGAAKAAIPGAQVRPIPNLDVGSPEFHVEPRRDALARHGLSGSELGAAVDALIDGRIIGELARGGRPKLDVVVRPEGGGLASNEALANASIATPNGSVVPLRTVADVAERSGPTRIRRIERSSRIWRRE